MKLYIFYILAVFSVFAASAQMPVDSVSVYFRVGHSQFEPAYDNNGASMDSFIERIRTAGGMVDHIEVRGYASPEGRSDMNKRLSQERCETIAEYIIKHAGIQPDIVKIEPIGVAWDLLRQLILETPGVPARERVLEILDNVPVWVSDSKGTIIDSRKKQLMEVAGGSSFRWMSENLFPELRKVVAVTVYYKMDEPKLSDTFDEAVAEPSELSEEPQLSEKPAPAEEPVLSEVPAQAEQSELSRPVSDSLSSLVPTSFEPKPYYFAVKTNMLYDAALVPNIGAEFYLGKNLSVYGEWMYAWWDNNKHHRYWRIYGGDLGFRWWFGKKAHAKPLTGHHVGIYGGIITFDFELGGKGYMGGKPGGNIWDRCIVNSGIEYGYSLPVGKHLNIDFSIAFGCLYGNYIKYYPFDNDYYREKEFNLRYFGPTKAEISLVWLLGRGNTNDRKGGGK